MSKLEPYSKVALVIVKSLIVVTEVASGIFTSKLNREVYPTEPPVPNVVPVIVTGCISSVLVISP
ncbi:MAG: hypothetical protein QF535_11115 [Anaerolineales bacterium]|nr:hypothetical protein [Anaerolineales bacterium]